MFNATFIFFQLYMDDTRVAEKTTFRRSMTIVTTGHLGMHVVQINMQYYILCSIQIFPFANSLFSVFFSFISYLLTISVIFLNIVKEELLAVPEHMSSSPVLVGFLLLNL